MVVVGARDIINVPANFFSGTTGNPKAVMMSHDNLTWTCACQQATGIPEVSMRVVSYLPLSKQQMMFQALECTFRKKPCQMMQNSIDSLQEPCGPDMCTLWPKSKNSK